MVFISLHVLAHNRRRTFLKYISYIEYMEKLNLKFLKPSIYSFIVKHLNSIFKNLNSTTNSPFAPFSRNVKHIGMAGCTVPLMSPPRVRFRQSLYVQLHPEELVTIRISSPEINLSFSSSNDVTKVGSNFLEAEKRIASL